MEKKCRKCGESFPSTLDFFYPRKGNKDGLISMCKKCWILKSRKYGADNREKVNKLHKEYYENYK